MADGALGGPSGAGIGIAREELEAALFGDDDPHATLSTPEPPGSQPGGVSAARPQSNLGRVDAARPNGPASSPWLSAMMTDLRTSATPPSERYRAEAGDVGGVRPSHVAPAHSLPPRRKGLDDGALPSHGPRHGGFGPGATEPGIGYRHIEHEGGVQGGGADARVSMSLKERMDETQRTLHAEARVQVLAAKGARDRPLTGSTFSGMIPEKQDDRSSARSLSTAREGNGVRITHQGPVSATSVSTGAIDEMGGLVSTLATKLKKERQRAADADAARAEAEALVATQTAQAVELGRQFDSLGGVVEGELARLMSMLEQQASRIDMLERALQTERRNSSDLRERSAKATATVRSAESAASVALQEVERLSEEVAVARVSIERLEEDVRSRDFSVSELTLENKTLCADIETAKERENANLHTIAALEKSRETQAAESAQLAEQIAALQSLVAELQKAKDSSATLAARAHAQEARQVAKTAELATESDKHAEQVRELTRRVSDQSSVISSLMAEGDATAAENTSLMKEIDSQGREIERLTRVAAGHRAEIAAAKESTAQAREDADKRMAETNVLRSQLSRLRSLHSAERIAEVGTVSDKQKAAIEALAANTRDVIGVLRRQMQDTRRQAALVKSDSQSMLARLSDVVEHVSLEADKARRDAKRSRGELAASNAAVARAERPIPNSRATILVRNRLLRERKLRTMGNGVLWDSWGRIRVVCRVEESESTDSFRPRVLGGGNGGSVGVVVRSRNGPRQQANFDFVCRTQPMSKKASPNRADSWPALSPLIDVCLAGGTAVAMSLSGCEPVAVDQSAFYSLCHKVWSTLFGFAHADIDAGIAKHSISMRLVAIHHSNIPAAGNASGSAAFDLLAPPARGAHAEPLLHHLFPVERSAGHRVDEAAAAAEAVAVAVNSVEEAALVFATGMRNFAHADGSALEMGLRRSAAPFDQMAMFLDIAPDYIPVESEEASPPQQTVGTLCIIDGLQPRWAAAPLARDTAGVRAVLAPLLRLVAADRIRGPRVDDSDVLHGNASEAILQSVLGPRCVSILYVTLPSIRFDDHGAEGTAIETHNNSGIDLARLVAVATGDTTQAMSTRSARAQAKNDAVSGEHVVATTSPGSATPASRRRRPSPAPSSRRTRSQSAQRPRRSARRGDDPADRGQRTPPPPGRESERHRRHRHRSARAQSVDRKSTRNSEAKRSMGRARPITDAPGEASLRWLLLMMHRSGPVDSIRLRDLVVDLRRRKQRYGGTDGAMDLPVGETAAAFHASSPDTPVDDWQRTLAALQDETTGTIDFRVLMSSLAAIVREEAKDAQVSEPDDYAAAEAQAAAEAEAEEAALRAKRPNSKSGMTDFHTATGPVVANHAVLRRYDNY